MPPSLQSCTMRSKSWNTTPWIPGCDLLCQRFRYWSQRRNTSCIFTSTWRYLQNISNKCKIGRNPFNTGTGFLIYTHLYIKYSGDRWWGPFWKLCGTCSSDGFEWQPPRNWPHNSFQWNPRKFAGRPKLLYAAFQTLTQDTERMACSIQEDIPFILKSY